MGNDVLIVSSQLPKNEYDYQLSHFGTISSFASQRFYRLLADGFLAQDFHVDFLTAYTFRPLSNYRSAYQGSSLYLPIKRCRFKPFKYGIESFRARLLIKKWCSNHPNGIIIADGINYSASSAAYYAKKHLKKKVIVVVTDVPSIRSHKIRNPVRRYFAWKQTQFLTSLDNFVFLTDTMKEVFIKRSEQKYIVMEGLTTAEKLDSVSRPIVPIFSCLYAGLIGAEFGLVNLIEAFRLLPKDRFSLSLYGPWMLQSQYPNLAALPSNVHFMGETENSKILSAERAVNLLINPRPSSAYYTRFSFPSKTIEYLSSGTPVLTTKLPGIPPEYNPYLFFVDDETPQGLANAISKVADKGSGFLQVFGERGAEFVRTEKNSTVQARRIVDAFKI